MKQILLLSLLLVACGRSPETAIAPSPAAEAAGTYQTNGFLDYLCVALPPDKMPTVNIIRETDATVTLTYLQRYPSNKALTINSVSLTRLPDNAIELAQQGAVIGSVRTDRAFGPNGMERQALVLRVQKNAPNQEANFSFTGSKE